MNLNNLDDLDTYVNYNPLKGVLAYESSGDEYEAVHKKESRWTVRPTQIWYQYLRKTSFKKNAALVSYDNANYVIVTDNDNNKPSTSLLRVDLSPEWKHQLQISDFVSDNDDESIKDPNYESDSSTSSSSSFSTSSDSFSSSSSYSPG
ncbi:unnamed protein product [Diabrotica balteata]|uniref:Uncharacterized protein n=1 Tax=Diabrotica balteata TaxID=107213 RepID=A0A9N9T8S3_DIABA|nr:unnamed protein product [Diabrotica balteata]